MSYNQGFVYKVINARNDKSKTIKAKIKRNIEHLRYIATRPGAEIGENVHGLTGHINGIDNVEKADLKEILKKVGDDTKKNIKVWQTVLSLTEEEAVKNELTNKENWNDLVKKKLSIIQKEYDIEYQNLNYVLAYHNEEGHPHIHLVFWDNEGENKVENARVNYGKIRREFTKEIHKGELQELYDIKNLEKKQIKDNFISFAEEEKIKEEIKEIAPHLLNPKIIDKKLRDNKLKELIIDFSMIKQEHLSSFKYQYLKPEEKEQINKIIKEILKTSPQCKKSYDNYIEAHIKSKALLSSNEDYIKKEKEKVEKEIEGIIGNQVLKFIKEIKKEEFEEYEDNKKKYIVGSFVNEINMMLNQLSESQDLKAKRNMSKINRELSKQSKKELAIRLQDKSNFDWNM